MILARTYLIALLGALAAWAISLPLPFLLGPLFACLGAALAGLKMKEPGPVGDVMRTILGLAVGATITPAVVARLPEMMFSVMLIPFFLAAAGLLGYPYFRRICRFDPATSYYGAMPGGLQDMLLFGENAGGDPRALGLMHATRVLVVVTIMPFLMSWFFHLDLTSPPGQPAADIPPIELAIMVICAIGGWQLAKRLGLFGPSILGPMALGAAASLSDLIHARPPAEAIIAAQFFIGLALGARYDGVTLDEVRRIIIASLGFCVILGAISLVFAGIVIALDLAPAPAALMAFSPGGQAEMAVLAIVAGIDVAYVVAHHLVRLVVVITTAPLVARTILRRKT